MIYFVQPEPGGPVKIGFAYGDEQEARRRIRGVQCGCPWKLRTLGFMEGSYNREAGFHAMFAKYRTYGEWFSPQDDFLDWMHEHGMDPGPPLSFERTPNLELVK